MIQSPYTKEEWQAGEHELQMPEGKSLPGGCGLGRKTAVWAPEKVKPVVCAVPSRTLRASATLYIQSCEHTDINAWVKNVGGMLWDLSGDILRLLLSLLKSCGNWGGPVKGKNCPHPQKGQEILGTTGWSCLFWSLGKSWSNSSWKN